MVKKLAQKLVSLVFSLLLVLSTFPVYAIAVEDETDLRTPLVSSIKDQIKSQKFIQVAEMKIHKATRAQIQGRAAKNPKEKIKVVFQVSDDSQLNKISKLIKNKKIAE